MIGVHKTRNKERNNAETVKARAIISLTESHNRTYYGSWSRILRVRKRGAVWARYSASQTILMMRFCR